MARTQCLAGRGLSLPGSLVILSWYQRMRAVFGGILGEVFFGRGGRLGVFLGYFLPTLLGHK